MVHQLGRTELEKMAPPERIFFWQNRIEFWQKEIVGPPLKNAPRTPMLTRSTLVGVTSRGFGACSKDLASVYVRVSKIKSWIQQNAPGTQDSNCEAQTLPTPIHGRVKSQRTKPPGSKSP